MIAPRRSPRPSGLTLTELLVVIAIILLLSAATLPQAYVAFAEREVSEAASLVQANISLTRDRAAGTGQPQGIRFLPDPDLTDTSSGVAGGAVASNRMVALSTPPNYSEGMVIPIVEIYNAAPYRTHPDGDIRRLAIYGAKSEFVDSGGGPIELPLPPTSWYYNIRQGDTIRIGGAGNRFTIAGPMTIGPLVLPPGARPNNPERFINRTDRLGVNDETDLALPNNGIYEVLYVVNGRDDNNNGYTDEQFDGIANNGFGPIDPMFNGQDDNGNGFIDDGREYLLNFAEYERDDPIIDAFGFARVNSLALASGEPLVRPLTSDLTISSQTPADIPISDPRVLRHTYSISRRPSVAAGAREYALPTGAVIDLTTSVLGSYSERSRLPVDPVTGMVELMIYPNGQVVPSTPYGFGGAMDSTYPLYFFWIAAREDVHPPTDPDPSTTQIEPIWPLLPLPSEAGGPGPLLLQGYRRLVTVSPTSGYASVSEIPEFGPYATGLDAAQQEARRNVPYSEARRFQARGR